MHLARATRPHRLAPSVHFEVARLGVAGAGPFDDRLDWLDHDEDELGGRNERARSPRTLLEHVVTDPRLTFVHRGVVATELAIDLVEGPCTLLAPVDAAFVAFERLAGLFDDTERVEELFDLFAFFLIRGRVERPGSGELRHATLFGETVVLEPDRLVTERGSARLIETIRSENGVIHLLDSVVSPASALFGPGVRES